MKGRSEFVDALSTMGAGYGIPPVVLSDGPNSRKHGRVRCRLTPSTLGEVLDLSASGARIRCRGKAGEPGTVLDLTISGIDGPIRVQAKIVWNKRVGLFRREVGVHFESPGPEASKGLSMLAQRVMLNDSLAMLEDRKMSA